MNGGARTPPRIAFDVNLSGLHATRLFWGTLCEETGQPLTVMPTAAEWTLECARLESEEKWSAKVGTLNRERRIGWTAAQEYGLIQDAARTVRDRLANEMNGHDCVYVIAPTDTPEVEELEATLEDTIDGNAFDWCTGDDTRDRRIVIEAFARNHNLVLSPKTLSVDQPLLRRWLKHEGRPKHGLTATVLDPEHAEEQLREKHAKPVDWIAHGAARACVTDPHDHAHAAEELADLIEALAPHGMHVIARRLERILFHEPALERVLRTVAERGPSHTARTERAIQTAGARVLTAGTVQ